MAIFDPKPNTSIAYEQPVEQAPSTGMALAELGSNFGEAFLDYRQQRAEASAPDEDRVAMAQFQDDLLKAQAARSQGNYQQAEQLESAAALRLQRNGLSVNENTRATFTAITGRPGEELLLSPEQVQLNQVRGSQEYEAAFLATYATGEDMTEEERDAMAISRVARQQGQAAMLQDQNISWTQGRRDAFFSVVSDFESSALGTLNLLAKEQGFVPQEALQQASLGWSEAKRGLLRMRPEGVSDEQWSQLEDRISQIDAELEALNELSSAEGIEARLAADLAAAIRGRDDWSAGKKLMGLSILSNPDIQATLSTTLDMKDIADALISDEFVLPTTPTQTEGAGGGTTPQETPGVFDNLPEDVTSADAETNFRRARNLGALLNQTGPESVSANPNYRNEFLQTTYVAFGAMNQIGSENRRFVTADGINETFNGKIVEGLRAAAQQNPVEAEAVIRGGVQALDQQFAIAQQQLTNTLAGSYLRLSRDGRLVLDEGQILSDAPVDQVRMLKSAVDEFYGGDIVAYAEDRGRRAQGSFPDLNRQGFSSRIASGLTNARSQLASVNAINSKRQEFMGLLDDVVETDQRTLDALEDVFEVEGLNISYQGDPDHVYGRQATANAQPFRGIVFHHTATGTDLESMVNYGKTVDEQRGGSFGYHFYIGRDGTIVQGAPLSKRTNHILPTEDVGLRNNNAIGISLVGSEEGATEAQMAAATRLGRELQDRLGISEFYGHGEIQGNRQEQEGRAAAEALRNGRPVELRSTERAADVPGAVNNATSEITTNPLSPDVVTMGQTAIEEAEEGTSLSPETSPAPEPRPTQEQPQERTQETDEASQEQSNRVGRATAQQENRRVRRLLRRIDLDPSEVPSFSSEEQLKAAIESGELKENDVYVLNGVIGDVGEEDLEAN